MNRALIGSISVLALAIAAQPAIAAPGELPDHLELGRDSNGDPCSATRYWSDPATPDLFAESYSVTCRGATANRFLGVARRLQRNDVEPLDALLDCSAPTETTVPSLGRVEARRCLDKQLGLATVETRMVSGSRLLSVSVTPSAQGPGEEALRLLARSIGVNSDRQRTVPPSVQVDALAPPPQGAFQSASLSDGATALDQGLRFIRQGLYMEGSRVLNDALARLPSDAPIATRIDLLLVAGLADSNLRFFDSSDDYFARAEALLAANPSIPDAANLARKRRTYAALDLLNRRQFATAVGALEQLSSSNVDPLQPLLDPIIVRGLNQAARQGQVGQVAAVSLPNVSNLNQLVIDAQSFWARSVGLLAQNKPEEAAAALRQADRSFAVLQNEQISQLQVRWLEARIERQRARLLLRTGNRGGAVAALDKAIDSLKRAELNGSIGPTLAETQIERAGIRARGGGNRTQLLGEFREAVDSLISSESAGVILPPAIEQYLDMLVAEAAQRPQSDAAEQFFRTLQAIGDPAIARQFVQLQTVVTADPRLAARVRDRQDLERELTRIRYEIAATPAAGAAATAPGDLEARRTQLESQLIALNDELKTNRAYQTVNDAPATIAELRQVLQPGEAYFKLSKVRNYAFGILIDNAGARIYRVDRPVVELEPLAQRVRDSIDGGGEKLPVFDVAGAYAMFQLVAGPVAERLLGAQSLIVDGSGPLQTLPIGVLVTDQQSVRAFAQTRSRAAYDYSRVGFLAKHVPISTALSPRSLIVARSLAPSTAPLPFMGFAEHMPAPLTASGAGQVVAIGNSCEAEESAVAALTRRLTPIDARELQRAGTALGLTQIPQMTGAGFTDDAVKRTPLDQFQVLHFATHGLTEGQWACSKSPPALVTSLGSAGSDALLSFDEIAKLRLDANLVVLSACDTAAGVSVGGARASGQEEAGATLEGLVRAFLTANARAVLSTYWPISDAGESETLIEDFYGAARGGSIGEALRTAQSALMTDPQSSHPLYWGAFFIVGDAQKSLLTGAARTQVAVAPGAGSGVVTPSR